jgi:hypothetical protein
MFKFLPQKEKKLLQNEYRIRVLIVLLFIIFFTEVIGIVALVPSYVLSKVKKEQITNQKEVFFKTVSHDGSAEMLEEFEASKNLLKRLTPENKVPESRIVKKITEAQDGNISLNSFRFVYKEGEQGVDITGVADSRESLVSYRNRLSREESFTSVDLPISNLADNKDISFVIKIKTKI